MSDMVMLAADFTPGDHDVICQRGKDSFEHVGNQRFRKCIDDHLSMYMSATTRQEKSSIVSKIYDEVREKATKPCGGFVKKDLLTRMWFQVSEKEARDKVGQALRDAIKIVRGSTSRRKASEGGHNNTNNESPHQKKKMRTAAHDRGAPQLKPANATDTSLKLALGAGRRFDQAPGNLSSARTFLENQVNALGPFPLSSGGLRGWEETAEGANVKSMLESVFEPLESSFTGQQSIDLSKLNRKRRLSLSQDAFGAGGRQIQQAGSLFDEQMEQMAQKRALQMIGGSDFGGPVPAMGALRRLSLFGDQLFQDSTQQGAPMTSAASLQANAGLLGLSSFGAAHQLDLDATNLATATAAVSRTNPEALAGLQQVAGTAPQQPTWDLEPTPLSGSQQGLQRPRLG